MLGPTLGRRSKGSCGTSQGKRAAAVSSGYEGITRPQYRLRVGEVRVFYDVSDSTVEILAIVPKSEADLWLALYASPQ